MSRLNHLVAGRGEIVVRRLIILCALVGGLAWGSQIVAAQAPTVTVTPAGGNQFQSFVVRGERFTPGASLETWWMSPDNEWFTTYTGESPAVTVVPASGIVRIMVVPAVDFAGAKAGKWTVYLCTAGTSECWSAEFTVST